MKRAAMVVAVAALSQFGTAHAQDNLAAALCKRIQTDAERLRCYDAMGTNAAKPAAPEPSAPEPAQGEWLTKDDRSPVDDSPQFTAGLNSTDSKGMFVVRCREKATDAALILEQFINTRDSIKVVYRINDGKPVEAHWGASSTGRGAFIPSPVGFLRGLKDNSKLFFRVYDYQGNWHDVTFMIGQFSAHRQRLADICKWSNPQKP